MSKQLRKTQSDYQPYIETSVQPFWRRRSVRWSAAIIVLLLVAGAMAVSSGGNSFVPEVEGAPSAAIEQTAFDHGDIPINQPVETTYTIRNVGDQQLRFDGTPQIKVVEGCCPPQVHLSDTVLNPGEEATIHMQYSMHAGMAGPHLFELTVETNDPANPIIVLTDRSNWIE